MKKYEKAKITLVALSFEDVITASGNGYGYVLNDDGSIDGEMDRVN